MKTICLTIPLIFFTYIAISQDYFGIDSANNEFKTFTYDASKGAFVAKNYAGELTKTKDGKGYFKFSEVNETSKSNMKFEQYGFYSDIKCIDTKLSSILFNDNWLKVGTGGGLEILNSKIKYICYAGLNTENEGLYINQNGWQKVSAQNNSSFRFSFNSASKKLNISLDENVQIKHGCFILMEGKKDNVLLQVDANGNFIIADISNVD